MAPVFMDPEQAVEGGDFPRGNLLITKAHYGIFKYMKNGLFDCYDTFQRDTSARKILSDHKQWHPLICEIYNRLRGRKGKEKEPSDIVEWLFPDTARRK